MSRAAHSKHKVEVLAHSMRLPSARAGAHASGFEVGDLRLVASPLRYKVQMWQYVNATRIQTWADTKHRFPRTRRQYVEWEYECAVSMFLHRCWERWMVKQGRVWPSVDGRMTQIHRLTTPHLRNIIAKIERDGNWRERFLPVLKEELDRRFSYTV